MFVKSLKWSCLKMGCPLVAPAGSRTQASLVLGWALHCRGLASSAAGADLPAARWSGWPGGGGGLLSSAWRHLLRCPRGRCRLRRSWKLEDKGPERRRGASWQVAWYAGLQATSTPWPAPWQQRPAGSAVVAPAHCTPSQLRWHGDSQATPASCARPAPRFKLLGEAAVQIRLVGHLRLKPLRGFRAG